MIFLMNACFFGTYVRHPSTTISGYDHSDWQGIVIVEILPCLESPFCFSLFQVGYRTPGLQPQDPQLESCTNSDTISPQSGLLIKPESASFLLLEDCRKSQSRSPVAPWPFSKAKHHAVMAQ